MVQACVVVSGDISMDTRDEEKSINTAVSPAPIYTGSIGAGTMKGVYAQIFHTHMCHNLSTHTSINIVTFLRLKGKA